MRTTGGIPRKVLSGKDRKFYSVHTVYKAYFLKRFMELLNASFWARAKGGTDDLGNKWKPLKPITHAYKPLSPMEKKTFAIGGKRYRGLLTPQQDAKWAAIYASKLKQFKKQGISDPEKRAAQSAWNLVKAKFGGITKKGLHRITDINVRTGRLVKATRAGTVSNNRYYPPGDQKISMVGSNVRLSFSVPYIDQVDKERPVIPSNCKPWIEEAHRYALDFAKRQYDVLRQDTGSNRRTPKRPAKRGTQARRSPSKPRR